jgi:hypothetical protein
MNDRLFDTHDLVECSDLARDDEAITSSAFGAIAEQEAIVELVKRGHRVAVPVVDDHGVDLVVNYRVAVQVKATTTRFESGHVHVSLFSGKENGEKVPGLREHVDALIVRVPTEDAWFIFPRSVLEEVNAYRKTGMAFHLTAAGTRGISRVLASYRDRWDVFDYPENFA